MSKLCNELSESNKLLQEQNDEYYKQKKTEGD